MAITRSKRRRQLAVSRSNLDLPLDLVFDILSRLHVKPLLKFKSACKTWFTLIQNPTFIKTHLTRSKKNHNIDPLEESMLVVRNFMGNYMTWLKVRDRNGTTYETNRILFRHFISVRGICDGLVCADLRDHETIIFNPIIGKIRRISPSYLPISLSDIVFLGFGLLESDGYSLFRIVYSHSQSGNVVLRGELYSMHSDNWKEIGVKRGGVIDPHMYLLSNISSFFLPVQLDGVFYWQAKGSSGGYVVSFDTCENMFEEIPWPVGYSIAGGSTSKILNFKGEPARPVPKGLLEGYDLWVFNVKERSWTKKFMLEDLSRIGWGVSVYGCARNGKLVLKHSGRELVSYDTESREFEDLPFHIVVGNHLYLYSSSLLSV